MRLEQEVNIYGDAEILKRFQAAETSISVVQGNISALISESELIELQNSHTTMYSQMASLKLDVDDLELSFSDLQTKYNTVTGQYTELSSKVAEYKAGVDGLSADITAVEQNLEKNYSTTTEMNAAIEASVDGLSSTVSKTYATTTQVTAAQNNAISSAKSYTDTQKTSALETAKGYADDAEAAANANTANRLKSYSTTAQMNSAINQKANEITTSVSSTYATKSALNNANSEIDALQTWRSEASLKITDSAIVATVTSSSSWATKADKANLISQINQSAEQVAISASKIKLEGIITANGNFKILADGSMETIKGRIGGWTINNTNLKSPSGNLILDSSSGVIYTMRQNGNKGVVLQSDGLTMYGWALNGDFVGTIATGYFSDTQAQAMTIYSDYGDLLIFGMQTESKDKTNIQLALSDRETNGYKIGTNVIHDLHVFGDIYARSKIYIGDSDKNSYFQLNSDGGVYLKTSAINITGEVYGGVVHSMGRRTATCNNQIYFQWESTKGKIAVFVDTTFMGYLSLQ
ncbi:MAG: hypothetical protein ACLVD1_09980 [Lacrimispora saccharolytica]